MEAYRIVALDRRHDRLGFECGVEPLDRYFCQQIEQEIRRRVAACFVAVRDPGKTVAGFYTLSALSISLTDLPVELGDRLPRYPNVPATLMGRLAVDHRHRGKRLGELLLFDAFARALRSEIATYAFVVDAKDDRAQAFYERYRFRALTDRSRRLFIPLAEIAKLLAVS